MIKLKDTTKVDLADSPRQMENTQIFLNSVY
jgi:hypothetical protein